MKHTPLDNLRLIAEYVYFDDAPALLGISRALLTRYAKGQQPNAANAARIAEVAQKIRRREAQIKRHEREKAERESRREARRHEQVEREHWRQSLNAHGVDLPMPARIPQLLRVHDVGAEGAPVYIYDLEPVVSAIEAYRLVDEEALYYWRTTGKESPPIRAIMRYYEPSRDVLEYWREEGFPNPETELELFYDALRRILPRGQAFLTYEVCPGGTTEQGGRVVADERNLRMQDNGCYVFSTTYWRFWRSFPGGIDHDIVNSPARFLDFFWSIHDATKKRRVIEIGVTYPAITKWRSQDLARFAREGLSQVWGVKFTFED